jgi:hypothetical protein
VIQAGTILPGGDVFICIELLENQRLNFFIVIFFYLSERTEPDQRLDLIQEKIHEFD